MQRRRGGKGEAGVPVVEAVAAPVGRCLAMCPPGELSLRIRQGRLHRLEQRRGSAPSAAAVKEYSRPAAGKPPPRPEELRPPHVLLATVRHLLALDGQEEEEEEGSGSSDSAAAFVSDRLRAVRLDVSLQRLPELRPGSAAAVLERALVWLLHAGPRRCFDPHDAPLHRGHVHEAFAALRRAYRRRREEEEEEEEGRRKARLPCQSLFQALFLLYNLGSAEVLWETLQLPEDVRKSPELQAALAINGAFLERNFARFFRLAAALPYLPSCALHPHLANARRLALMTFSYGFSARNCRYPLAPLARLLATDDTEEASELCQAFGLPVVDGHVAFQKGSFKDGPPKPGPSRLLVEGKRGKATLLEIAEKFCS